MKKGRHFSSGNVKVYCSGYGLIGSPTSWAAFGSNLWPPVCQLLLKEMFGYWEDVSVAPGLSDFQGHRGFMCHVRGINKGKTGRKKRRRNTGEETMRLWLPGSDRCSWCSQWCLGNTMKDLLVLGAFSQTNVVNVTCCFYKHLHHLMHVFTPSKGAMFCHLIGRLFVCLFVNNMTQKVTI